MNILFLADHPFHYRWGGVNAVTRTLATQLKNLGHNPFLISYCEKPSEVKEDELKDILFINRNDPDQYKIFNNFIKENEIDFLINQSWEKHIYNFLKNCDLNNIKTITVIHTQPFTSMGKERIIKSLSHPKTIKDRVNKYITLLCPYPMIWYKLRQQRKFFYNFSSISDKICLLSKNYIARVYKYYSIFNIDKLIAINNPTTFKISNDALDIGNKENIVLWVGRFEEPQKNIKGFLDIWKVFSEQHPDWHAIMVGDGVHKNIYENYAKHSNLKKLEFAGSQSNVAQYYRRSKILCMTSLYEGWPMVIMEAMAYGCVPVVYNSYEAASNIIKNKETGLLVKAFDKKEMIVSLNYLVENPKILRQMAEKGESTLEEYSSDKIVKCWIENLSNL